jgi:hypothetical protein
MAQDGNLQFLTSKPKSNFMFRDQFNYPSIVAMVAEGWSLCGGAPLSHLAVERGNLTLQNDGVTGAAVCWSNIPAGITSWTIRAQGKWVGGYYGSIEQVMKTTSHVYRWDADGYFSQFILLRDDVIVFRANGYAPGVGNWHVLSMSMTNGTISLFFDGTLTGHFTEPDPTVPLSSVELWAGWESITSWNYVTASGL